MTSGDGSELIKITEKVTDLIHKLSGPLADEVGQMLGDKVRVYRVRNWIKTVQKTDAMLRDAGLPANAVSPRLLLPIIEGCSVEDNETLQDLWAGLLATASQKADALSPSFVETLKQLTPDEARFLEKLYTGPERRPGSKTIPSYAFIEQNGAPQGARDSFERLGLVRREYTGSFKAATHGDGIVQSPDEVMNALGASEVEVGYWREWTDYAKKFWEACHGPRKSVGQKEG